MIIFHRSCFSKLLRINPSRLNINSIKFSDKKNHNIPTLEELKIRGLKILGLEKSYDPQPKDRSYLIQYVPNLKDLPPRSIKDSFLQGIIPLSTDLDLREKYVSFLGRARVEKLLEDMDLFAVHVGYQHIKAPTVPEDVPSPYVLVTARCGHIDFTAYRWKHNEDAKVSGYVSLVGKSSMEIVIFLHQHFQGSWHKITRAFFTMVARNATNSQSVQVNPLVPANETEKEIIKIAQAHRERYLLKKSRDIMKILPSQEEQERIHKLYQLTKMDPKEIASICPHGIVPMRECKLSNVVFCHPVHRNYQNTVFGGFIMKKATECAWILGYEFCKQRPFVSNIQDILFLKPVEINSIVRMEGQIIYTHENFMQVQIKVILVNSAESNVITTNSLNYTLKSNDPVRKVFPESYHESMKYTEGRRYFQSATERCCIDDADCIDEYFEELSKETCN